MTVQLTSTAPLGMRRVVVPSIVVLPFEMDFGAASDNSVHAQAQLSHISVKFVQIFPDECLQFVPRSKLGAWNVAKNGAALSRSSLSQAHGCACQEE